MNFFEIDFIAKMKKLLTEAFKFKKYKAMHPALAVFTGIFMIPVVLMSFAVTAFLAALSFIYAVFSSPVKFLHALVSGEGKTVMHATQAIIYLISWPTILLFYAFLSFLLLFILPAYALLSFLLYIWSLGGFKFHLFANADDIEKDVKGAYGIVLPLVFILVSAVLLVIIPLVHGIIYFMDLYSNYLERFFFDEFFGGIYPSYIGIQTLFATLFSLLGFASRPKKEEAPAEIAEEN